MGEVGVARLGARITQRALPPRLGTCTTGARTRQTAGASISGPARARARRAPRPTLICPGDAGAFLDCSAGAAMEVFDRIDTDGSGTVDFDEFCVWLARRKREGPAPAPAEGEESRDADGDGTPYYDEELLLHVAPRCCQ